MLQTRGQTTSQPLYFSRTKLSQRKRLNINERKLERELRKKNFFICYPEELSLKEQIHLINKHEIIIGTLGSALHGILFDISPVKNMVCFGQKETLNIAFLIIDAIKSVNSTYIGALELKENSNLSKTRIAKQNRILDLDVAIEGLKNIGLL